MNDPREAIEEIRKLKARAEKKIASDMQNVLFDLEGRTGMCAQGIRVQFADVTSIGDDRPRFMVSSVDVDLGRI